MTPRLPTLTLTLSLLLLAAAAGNARADEAERLPESINRIERETGGRVLSAQPSQRGGREVNRIKVYTPQGRVRVMWDDPAANRERNAAPRQAEPVGPRRPSGHNGVPPTPSAAAARTGSRAASQRGSAQRAERTDPARDDR